MPLRNFYHPESLDYYREIPPGPPSERNIPGMVLADPRFTRSTTTSRDLTMIDAATPLNPWPRQHDCVLIYVGGDTPDPWTDQQVNQQTCRYRWPCWVRSDPQGSAQGFQEGSRFAEWMKAHGIPWGRGHSGILDLETAVDTAYVNAFNSAMYGRGYNVTKYGSIGTVFGNPPTSGGTYVANPTESPHMVTIGDTRATQWGFFGSYDLSEIAANAIGLLWDTKTGGSMNNIGGHYIGGLSQTLLDDGTRLVAGIGVDGHAWCKRWHADTGWQEFQISTEPATSITVASNGGSNAQAWYSDPVQAGNLIELNSTDSGRTWS